MKKSFLLIVLILLSLFVVVAMYVFPKFKNTFNGFTRHSLTQKEMAIYIPTDSLALSAEYYLGGHSGDTLYVANRKTSKLYFLTWARPLMRPVQIQKEKLSGSLEYLVHSPFLYITSASNQHLWIASLKGGEPRMISENRMIADYYPIDGSNVILKTWNDNETELELGRLSGKAFTLYPELLEKQIDGKFCTDGKLLFNAEKSLFIYVYYYRNQWIMMDSTLSLLQRHSTIDTISQARIRVSTIHSERTESLSSPARITNQLMTSSGTLLLIQSTLKADNENSTMVKYHSAVDVYHLPDGKYLGSFYIPFHNGRALREFELNRNVLTVRFRDLLVSGPLPGYLQDHE